MKKQVIAVYDIGKTNKKLLLFDLDFNLVSISEDKFPVIWDEDGFECDDIDLITSWITSSLNELLNGNKFKVLAVNFSTYGASLIFLDKNGCRLTPVYNYLKEVPSYLSENLFSEYGGINEFCRSTASPALGFLLNSGIQMLWIQKEKQELFSKVKSILHLPQYLSFTLTRKIISEPPSIGCHTFLWDFDKMKYHQWVEDKGFVLPEPVSNNTVFPIEISGEQILVGTGIHDSSASLVPYLKNSTEKFVLISTGTWCINMNPFNNEQLTIEQLKQDCLCYLTTEGHQVKSSRLFMGHFHEVWIEKLASHFHVPVDFYKSVKTDRAMINNLIQEYDGVSEYFKNGKDSFANRLENIELNIFVSYEEAYTKLMIDLTRLCIQSIQLVIPENDEKKVLFVSGGFSRNEIFVYLLKQAFPDKGVVVSDIDNSSALGAAMVIAESIENIQ